MYRIIKQVLFYRVFSKSFLAFSKFFYIYFLFLSCSIKWALKKPLLWYLKTTIHAVCNTALSEWNHPAEL